jgi:Tfp pilus assembly protein PilN
LSLFKTIVGIDPSGRRLAVAAVQGGVGDPVPAVPPVRFDLRSERESARLEEAGELLREFVARHGLGGCEARLCIPADRVFSARIDFPPLRARDMAPALSMEIERLFPFPASKMRFRWRRIAGGSRVLVVAAQAAWIDRWAEIAGNAGLRLAGAIPSDRALSAAFAEAGFGKETGPFALIRELGDAVECTLLAGGEPFFSASRPCPAAEAAAEGLALAEEGMLEAPSSVNGTPVPVAPPGWFPASSSPDGRFEAQAAKATGAGEDAALAWDALGAYGAAVAGDGIDLLVPESEGPWPRIAAVSAALLAAAALLLGIAWPATRYVRAKAELKRLDARIEALRPAVERVGDSMAAIDEIEARIAILREASPGAGQPLDVLRELTARIPQGSWLTGLRLEGSRVELDGFSPSANDLFPILSQDGRFRKVEFASPITRQPDNLERFQIRAEYTGAAPKPGKPEGGGA